MWRVLRRFAHSFRSLCVTVYDRVGAFLSGPVRQFVVGPFRVALLGQHRDVSLLVTLLSPVLALGTAWLVGSTVGYHTLTAWVRGTWFGTDPSLAIFLAIGGLLVIGAISAAVNSGLLPTSVLVSAPVFGAGVTRYGTTVTYSWGSDVVSLPEAVGVASLLAVGFGIPIALCGFVLGRALCYVISVYGGRSGPPSTVENA
ncbi:hypothetical protein [Halobellus ruber]|nr:hypothetical protein [Halobellus ruber]